MPRAQASGLFAGWDLGLRWSLRHWTLVILQPFVIALKVTVSNILGAVVLVSFALLVWQFVVAMRFPLHKRIPNSTFAPDISILKPLKGLDSEGRACLESWMIQKYGGRLQILFGVHSPDDPVCEVVRGLITAYPQVDAELVICPKMLGPNAKVSTLIQLQRLAKYEVIAISDADVWAPADFLAQAVLPLEKTETGLVNCFYMLAYSAKVSDSAWVWTRTEEFAVNGDFWGQVLQARSLKPLDFALGAAMITHWERLRRIGGFEGLVDYLADDYQLGNRIAKDGGRVVLSSVVVECRSEAATATEVWQHQLRWARTIRVSEPVPYFFSILNNSTLWAHAWLFGSGFSRPAIFGILAYACVRWSIGLLMERRLTGKSDPASIPALLAADWMRAIIWVLSFPGNKVAWRGRKYRLSRGGKMEPLNA